MFNLGTVGNMQVGDILLFAIIVVASAVFVALSWEKLGGKRWHR